MRNEMKSAFGGKKFWQKFFKKNKFENAILPKKFRKMPKWKIAVICLFYFCIFCVLTVAIAFAWYAKDLPTPAKIAAEKPAQSTKLYDRTGTVLLYETGNEKRTVITSDQISNNLKEATVATEDANFYRDYGFSVSGVASAVWSKITGRTAVLHGGSTITQQYVKNTFLTDDRSFSRKFKELILSIELEFMYNKDQILTMYLNQIPYGNSTAGAEAASQMYFGKNAKDLDLAEAATLAAIPQAPTYYSPYGTHTQALINRKNYVLDRMVETGKITKTEAEAAKTEDTLALGKSLKPRREAILAPHFAMYVLEQVVDKYGEDVIQKQGLKITTTLDYDKQQKAQQSIDDNRKMINRYNAENAALVSIDPKTGQILAMVGSVDYFDTTIDGNVNVTDSLRQPGSSFKVFEYSTLLKQKDYSPSKIFYDVQTDFGGGYVPRNYSGRFSGAVTMRYALQNSLNIPAIKALSLAGIDNTVRTAEDLGITSLTKPTSYYGLSLAIGTAEVKPVEMASAFGTLANQGNHQDLTPFLKITDSSDKVLYDFDNDHKSKQVLDPQITYEMSNMLSDNSTRTPTFGARSALYFSDRTVAAKTGTTQDNRDGWTCGYTPSLATAVWVGNNMPSPMKTDAVIVAGPIFHEYMTKALEGTPNEPFDAPSGIQTITVDKFSNKLPTDFSSDKTTDIFASWQVPTTSDDVHVQVKICPSNGLLAPNGMSDSLTAEKTFINLHSERPDNPNWENPVRALLASMGMDSLPPTSYCDAGNATPVVNITSPSNGSTVSGNQTIVADVSAFANVQSVQFFVDNVSIGTAVASPYSINYNFDSLSSGSHTISIVATDASGTTAKNSITVTTATVKSGPSISNISFSISGTTETITWITDIPSTSQVLYKLSNAQNYQNSTASSSLSTSHSVQITIILTNTYDFQVVSVDGNNNESKSSISQFKT